MLCAKHEVVIVALHLFPKIFTSRRSHQPCAPPSCDIQPVQCSMQTSHVSYQVTDQPTNRRRESRQTNHNKLN